MCRWCLGRVSVMCSDCVVMFWWYVGDALVLCWWCLCSVSVMLWCLSDGWWCCGDVFVMVLWCFGDEYWWTFSNFQWVPKQNEWLFDVCLLLGSYAGLIFFKRSPSWNFGDVWEAWRRWSSWTWGNSFGERVKIHTDTQTTSTEATYEDLLFQQETLNIPIFWGGETNLLQLMESVSGPCCTLCWVKSGVKLHRK